MRKSYALTPQTKGVLENHVKVVADEMETDVSNLYAILAGKKTDPYALFRRLFRAAARKRTEQAKLYILDLQSLIPSKSNVVSINPTTEDAVSLVSTANIKLMAAYSEFLSGDIDKETLKARASEVVKVGNQLMQILDPPEATTLGNDEKVRNFR
jgi:hypothetical protein